MKTTHALILALLFLGTAASHAQQGAVEPISTVLVPGQPFEQFFPNVFDPNHPKYLRFEALVLQPVAGVPPVPLLVHFDWLDLNGNVQVSPAVQYDIIGGQPNLIDTEWWLPFCPERVSLHLEIPINPVTVPLFIEGRFTHQCVPEGDSVLAGIALLGLVGGAWWHRRA